MLRSGSEVVFVLGRVLWPNEVGSQHGIAVLEVCLGSDWVDPCVVRLLAERGHFLAETFQVALVDHQELIFFIFCLCLLVWLALFGLI